MMNREGQILRPSDTRETAEIIQTALAEKRPIEVLGNGTKRGLGRPVDTLNSVSLSGISGITLYQPEELVVTAGAGTSFKEIREMLQSKCQHLAFEPPDWGPIFGEEPDTQTIGGIIATNLSGSRRIQSGAARDHLLGAEMVTGRGEIVRTGGRVVKNVTGYDLCKLISGSYGTLGLLTKLTLKVLPIAEKVRTLLILALEEEQALSGMTAALSSPHDVSAAAFLPIELAQKSGVNRVADINKSIMAIRIEGVAPSVEARLTSLRHLLSPFGDSEELHFRNSKFFWEEIGNGYYLSSEENKTIWRISVSPSDSMYVARQVRKACDAKIYFDWGGGLLWVGILPELSDGGSKIIRAAIKVCGGHATIIRARKIIRENFPVFQPAGPVVFNLNRRIKEGFDPKHILNPGRLEKNF